MPAILAKFVGEYGNYERGHRARPQIEDISIKHPLEGPIMSYLVSYDESQYGGHQVKYSIDERELDIMRTWLVSKPIVGEVAKSYTAGEVLRRIEQYYGHNGLAEFHSDFEAALEADYVRTMSLA